MKQMQTTGSDLGSSKGRVWLLKWQKAPEDYSFTLFPGYNFSTYFSKVLNTKDTIFVQVAWHELEFGSKEESCCADIIRSASHHLSVWTALMA